MEVGEVLSSVQDDYCEDFYKYYLHDFVRNVHKSQSKKQEQAETEYSVSICDIIIVTMCTPTINFDSWYILSVINAVATRKATLVCA